MPEITWRCTVCNVKWPQIDSVGAFRAHKNSQAIHPGEACTKPEPVEPIRDRDGNEWPKAYTHNGTLIVPGLVVLDYNWRVSTVTDEAPHLSHGVYWFTTDGGLFDGSRMTTRDPNTGKKVTKDG